MGLRTPKIVKQGEKKTIDDEHGRAKVMKAFLGNSALIVVLTLVLFIGGGKAAQAAEHYVRANAAGKNDGSSWTDAWRSFPPVLIRGDTYYIADGVYPPYKFDDAQDGTKYITIKKAINTAAGHGYALDWDPTYGDGIAELTGALTNYTAILTFTTGYYVFDGVVGQGKSGHGFKISTTSTDSESYLVYIHNGADYISISHSEICHTTMGQLGVVVPRTKGITVPTNDGDGIYDHLVISYNYIHDVTAQLLVLNYTTNAIVENNYFEHRLGGDYLTNSRVQTYIHGEGIEIDYCGMGSNNTIRYNTFKDIAGTAFIAIKDSVQSLFYIYGNIFFNTDSRFQITNGAIANTTGDSNSNMYVINNTFVNINGYDCGINWYNGSSNYTYNNIWYKCQKVSFVGNVHDYNWFFASGAQSEPNIQNGIGDPFVNLINQNFKLSAGTVPGKSDLGAVFATDMLGILRGGNDGKWDRGALEYVAIKPPANFRMIQVPN